MNTQSSAHASGWQVYKRLLGYTRRYWGIFGLGVAGFLINAQTEWAGAKLIQYIIEAIQKHDQHAKNLFPLLIIGVFFLRGVGTLMGNYYISLVSRNIVYAMRREIFDKLLLLPTSFYHQNSSGRIAAKLIYDVEQVTAAATEALKTIVREGFIVIFLFGYLLWTNWRLSLALFIIGPIAGWLVSIASKRFRKLSHKIQASMGDVNHIANETINGYQVVKTYGGEAYERKRFDFASLENLKQGMKMVVTQSITSPLVQMMMALGMSVVVWIALQPQIMGDISAGGFIAYITAAGLLAKPVRGLTDVNEKIQRGIAASASVFELLDMQSEVDTGTIDVERLQGDIEFRHVGFSYETGKPVLQDISLRVKPGQTVALVGRSGAGKTSLVNLLPRFYDATAGEILLDGKPLQSYTLSCLRRQIASVSQKVVLFDDSIANNIAYGVCRDRPRSDIEAAARAAYAQEFIETMPQGYDTPVGQDGMQLSGGQRQRIAIARALLKNAPILILDEATSALDNESEFYIQAALDEVIKGRTTFVIAHRLSTVENADWIVVMDQGRIVETGTHAELLARNGAYAQLHSRNFAEDDGVAPGAV
ncbi:MAG: lipid A export permease/ATP-binding protein MsbA [bacterium]|nr:lipid A export permease/ATP-binding protein MsbA [bacterium]